MKVTYDAQVDCAYIYLDDPGKKAMRTMAIAHEGINLDFDVRGALIGIEVMQATRRLPAALIATAQPDIP